MLEIVYNKIGNKYILKKVMVSNVPDKYVNYFSEKYENLIGFDVFQGKCDDLIDYVINQLKPINTYNFKYQFMPNYKLFVIGLSTNKKSP